jgi:hypothetical protein
MLFCAPQQSAAVPACHCIIDTLFRLVSTVTPTAHSPHALQPRSSQRARTQGDMPAPRVGGSVWPTGGAPLLEPLPQPPWVASQSAAGAAAQTLEYGARLEMPTVVLAAQVRLTCSCNRCRCACCRACMNATARIAPSLSVAATCMQLMRACDGSPLAPPRRCSPWSSASRSRQRGSCGVGGMTAGARCPPRRPLRRLRTPAAC